MADQASSTPQVGGISSFRLQRLIEAAQSGSNRDGKDDPAYASQSGEGQGTPFSAIVNLLATVFGVGILALPGAFALTGAALGAALMLGFAFLVDVCMQYLVLCARESCQKTYEDTAYRHLGTSGRLSINFSLIFLLFLATSAMLVIVMDLLPDFICEQTGQQHTWYSDPTLITGIVLCAIFPACLMENITALKYTSVLSLCCLGYFVVCLSLRFFAHRDGAWIHESVVWVNSDPLKILNGASIMLSAYVCQFNIFKIDTEMMPQHKSRIWGVMHISLPCVAAPMYTVCGLMGYFLFGAAVKSDLLSEFPDDTLMSVARCALAFVNIFKVPLIVQPLRSSIRVFTGKLVPKCTPLETLFLLAAVWFTAVMVGDLGKALAISALPRVGICFAIPALMKLRYDRTQFVSSGDTLLEAGISPEGSSSNCWPCFTTWCKRALVTCSALAGVGATFATVWDW